MLKRLGFNGSTHSVYRALLTGRYREVPDLARHIGLPEDEVRSALEELAKMDLLRPGGEGLGQLVDPQLGLKALLLQQVSGIEERVAEFEEDRSAVLSLIDRYREISPEGGESPSDFVSGREAIVRRLSELASATGSEWLAFVPGGTPSVSWLETVSELQHQVRARGGTTRTVLTDSIRCDKRGWSYPEWYDDPDGRARTVPSLPVHLLIIDRSLALLPADPADPWRSAMQLTAPGAVVALTALFDDTWERATPLSTPRRVDEHQLSPQEKELLRLMSSGLTDDVIRRRLGVSLRTVRRIVADLCERLDADSRFEAGYQAGRRGWI